MTKTISLTDEQHALMLHLLGYALQDLDDGPKVHALIEHVRAAAEPACKHLRVQGISRLDGTSQTSCMDCGADLKGNLPPVMLEFSQNREAPRK